MRQRQAMSPVPGAADSVRETPAPRPLGERSVRDLISELADLAAASRAWPAAAHTRRAGVVDPDAELFLSRKQRIIIELRRRRAHYRQLAGQSVTRHSV